MIRTDSRTSLAAGIAGIAAAAGALFRGPDGALWASAWASALLQLPLAAGWFGRRFLKSTVPSEPNAPGLGAGAAPHRDGHGASDRTLGILVIVGAAVLAFHNSSVDVFFSAITTFILGSAAVDRLAALYRRLERGITEPHGVVRALARPWGMMLVVATALLSLPVATKSAVPDYQHNFWLHVLSSGYSAVSAASLVGTSVYSLGGDYTLFGQCVIIIVTQLSGMGFAALGLAAIRPFLKNDIPLRDVLLIAFILQVVAVAILGFAWPVGPAAEGFGRLGQIILYTTDAIWNSGWTLGPDGLAPHLSHAAVFTTITTLAVVGSLGLPIILDLIRDPRGRRTGRVVTARPAVLPPWCRLAPWEAGAALALLVAVALLVFFFETPRFLPDGLVPSRPVDLGVGRVSIRDDHTHQERWTLSVFVSATLRSAGMQSMPLSPGAISWPTYGVVLLSMIVGGSLGGTGGGLRTTTVLVAAIALLYGRAAWSAHQNGTKVRRLLMARAVMYVPLWLGLNGAAVALLFATTDGTWYERLFDATAAINGAGLSTGLSLHLTAAGRLSIMAVMVLGRWLPYLYWVNVACKLADVTRPTAAASK